MTPTDEAPLTATNIEHTYGDVTVLDGATFDVPSGTLTAMIGPNGSGKTTLLQILCGLLTPDDGTVDQIAGEGRVIGYLPQQPTFRPGFTVYETIALYQRLVGHSDANPTSPLERVGLADVAGRPVNGLSGGMTRLLGVAQATIGDPSVVVLDEPTSGLDPGSRETVFEAVSDITTRGTGVLISSHALESVERYADRVVLLADGTIHYETTPNQLRERLDVKSLLEAYRATVNDDEDRHQKAEVSQS